MIEIVKIQTSMMRKGGKALIFPKDGAEAAAIGAISPKSRVKLQRLNDQIKRAMNGQASAFFRASMVDGRWKIGRKVQDQEW